MITKNTSFALSTVAFAILTSLFSMGCPSSGENSSGGGATTPSKVDNVTNPGSGSGGGSGSELSAVWANDGGYKVTRDERKATTGGAASVINSVWDGTSINVFGAKNEVVAFNLVLETGAAAASGISASVSALVGPGGSQISSNPTTASGVFNWTNRNIELFFMRYLQIKGLSRLSYETYDERHIPKRFQRPWTGEGVGSGGWANRPDRDKYYPEIAVPMELVPNFTIAANSSQSVWVDIYVPKTSNTGLYTGKVTLTKNGTLLTEVPIRLTVKNFTLPDAPSAKTMLYLGYGDVAQRYTGTRFPTAGTAQATKNDLVRTRHFMVAHRHKISLIDANEGAAASPGDRPRDEWLPRLSGSLFTSANGYAGPGVNTGNGVFSIGTYGTWNWQSQGEAGMRTKTDAWETWFQANSPATERFLYLIDESTNYAQTEQWAGWVKNNPGVGKNLKTFATLHLTDANTSVPSLTAAASWFTVGITSAWQSAHDAMKAAGKRVYMYNGKRPSNGSFATEDDGVALRELAWAQYKKGVDRWFFWESTYYNDYQGGRGQTNVFQTAQTFGGAPAADANLGQTGWNHSNGDGVLFYPGTDTLFPTDSYNLDGPISSLRLKMWRRGIQDVDYIAMANAIDSARTQAIVNRMVPKALWDYGVNNAGDPTWVRADISWSINPDDWEQARRELSDIIESGSRGPSSLASKKDAKKPKAKSK